MLHVTTDLYHELKKVLQNIPGVVAAWEGGSAATGYLDEYSDLDLEIVVEGIETDEVFTVLEEHFAQRYGIERSFRVPEPSWHGMSQCFYLLRDLPEFFYCDIAVVKVDNPHKFTEPDRHGNAVIWFDPRGLHSAEPTPPEDVQALAKRFWHIATDTDWLILIELRKALARKNWLASQMNYLQFVNRCLVLLLNLKYRPAKVDFGIRYAERDYPPEVAEELADLLRITCVEDIQTRLPQALAWYENLRRTGNSEQDL